MGLALRGWGCDRSTLAQIVMKLNMQQLASNQIAPTPMLLAQTTTTDIYKPALPSGLGISCPSVSSQC